VLTNLKNMSVNINNVYKAVLVITNKDNRGYITPEEFNELAAQAQNEIFEGYFARSATYEASPILQSDFSDPLLNSSEKINIFYKTGDLTKANDIFAFPSDFYKLGVISVDNIVADFISHESVKYVNLSPLTAPVKTQPVFTLVSNGVVIYPTTISTGVTIDYLRKPIKPKFGYLMPSAAQIAAGVPNEPIYDPTAFDPSTDSYSATAKSFDFELQQSEEHALVAKILSYAGVVIKQADVAGFAQGKDQQIQATEQ